MSNESPIEQRPPRWLIGGALLLVTLVAGYVRLADLTRDSLWQDEGLTIAIAKTPISQLFSEVRAREQTPPLSHLVAHVWINLFGDSDLSVRLPFALIGVLCVPAVYLLGRELFGWREGLLAAVLLAMARFHIVYSHEARAYTLLILFSILSTWSFARLMRDRRYRVQAVYVLCTALLLYTHLYGIFVVAAHHILYLGWRMWRQLPTRPWMLMQLAIGVLLLPLLVMVWAWVTSVSQGFWITMEHVQFYGSYITYAGTTGAMMLMLLAIGAALPWRNWRTWLMIWVAILPVAVPVLISIYKRPVYLNRYGMAAMIGMYVLTAAGVVRLGRVLGAALILGLLGILVYEEAHRPTPNWKADWRSSVAYINEEAAPTDVVLVTPFVEHVVGHYLDRPDVELYRTDMASATGALAAGRNVWLVDLNKTSQLAQFKGIPPESQRAFRHVTVYRFTPTPTTLPATGAN